MITNNRKFIAAKLNVLVAIDAARGLTRTLVEVAEHKVQDYLTTGLEKKLHEYTVRHAKINGLEPPRVRAQLAPLTPESWYTEKSFEALYNVTRFGAALRGNAPRLELPAVR